MIEVQRIRKVGVLREVVSNLAECLWDGEMSVDIWPSGVEVRADGTKVGQELRKEGEGDLELMKRFRRNLRKEIRAKRNRLTKVLEKN